MYLYIPNLYHQICHLNTHGHIQKLRAYKAKLWVLTGSTDWLPDRFRSYKPLRTWALYKVKLGFTKVKRGTGVRDPSAQGHLQSPHFTYTLRPGCPCVNCQVQLADRNTFPALYVMMFFPYPFILILYDIKE